MIFDRRWKSELNKFCYDISFWSKHTSIGEYSEYRLTRAVLYSATILRKITECEIEKEKFFKKSSVPLQEQLIVHTTLSAVKYKHIGEKGRTIRGRLCVSDYDKGEHIILIAKDVCNWLLHSYVWELVRYSGKNEYAGFTISSDYDKEKFVHYISFDEWKKLLKYAVESRTF